jgi:uncharacterized protein YceK
MGIRRNRISVFLFVLLLIASLCGCGSSQAPAEATTEVDYSSMVADKSEMIEEDTVVLDGMEPISGKSLNDGTYPITVTTSSAMFPVKECSLTAEKGKMTAVMTMSGTGYLYVFMGTGLEAAKADKSEYIPFGEDENGKHTFTVPVEALNAGIDCAAFSKKKQKWYNRKICFRADSLPEEAFAEDVLHTAENLGLKDGDYNIEVTLGGGTGRSEITSPTSLKVEDGKCTAVITWSSPNYDYMLVDDERYDRVNAEGNSTFEIPVKIFDMPMAVVGDTTAMSQPYEIDYTLMFDSSTIKENK